MCVVRMEKMPKLQTACTTPVAEGMVVTTETAEIAQARKATIELLLGNHPLDCPVCDAGGECELQDMTFKYGAGDIANTSRPSSIAKSSSGRRSSSSTARAASSATAACASAAKAWTSGRSASRTAASRIASIAPNGQRPSGLRRVRHVHRRLPRRRAHLRHLSLQDPPVGDEPRRHHLHALRRRMQDHARRPRTSTTARRSSAATIATRAASTATSSASRAATPSTSPTIPTA